MLSEILIHQRCRFDNIETLKKFPITLTELTSVTRQLVVLMARAKKSTVEAPFRM